MHLPCDNPCVECPPSIGGGRGPVDPANPFVNLSSEAPDFDAFIGRRYTPPGTQPPLGNIFYAVGCIGWCISSVSQEDANLCAARQANQCLSVNWPNVFPNPNPPPPVSERPRELFSSTQQSCSFDCPDGQPFTFTTAQGLFTAFSQAEADEAARTYACNQAVAQRICLSDLAPSLTCSETNYVGLVTGTSINTPLNFEIAGSLPPGLVPSSNENTLFITGVPTEPGDYTFSVVATDTNGSVMQKECSLTVFGITNESPLPEATLNEPYSVTLQVAGTVPGAVTFAHTIGLMPDGLTLNPDTGEISGTPTEEGPFSFTITAFSGTIACSRSFGLQVEEEGCVDWSQLSWGAASLFTQDGGTAVFVPENTTGETATAAATCTALATSDANATNLGTLIYNGPQCDCKVTLTIVNAPVGGALVQIGYVQVDDITIPSVPFFEPIFSNVISGVYEFFFSLPDTGGAPHTIFFSLSAFCTGVDEGAKAISVTATLDTA